jgi:hypothetical protein
MLALNFGKLRKYESRQSKVSGFTDLRPKRHVIRKDWSFSTKECYFSSDTMKSRTGSNVGARLPKKGTAPAERNSK